MRFDAAMNPVVSIVKHIGWLASSVVLLSACATAPVQEMSNARQSVQVAREVGAGEYAVYNLQTANEYLARAERELELRYFSRARHDAIVAKSEARKAHEVAVALQQAQAALADSEADEESLARARALLSEAMEAARAGRDRQATRLAREAERRAGATAAVDD
jgi:hypothetical protein